MSTTQIGKAYVVGHRKKVMLRALPLIFSFLLLPISAIALSADVILILAGEKPFLGNNILELFSLVGILLFCLTIPIAVLNSFSDIKISDGGLLVEVFIFRYYWKLVVWQDILSVRKSPRFDRHWQSVWVIITRRLTPWHRILSILYLVGVKPVILLTSDLEDREELIEYIKLKIQQHE